MKRYCVTISLRYSFTMHIGFCERIVTDEAGEQLYYFNFQFAPWDCSRHMMETFAECMKDNYNRAIITYFYTV